MALQDYSGKVFPSYDYDLCDNEECNKKNTCKRFITYKKAMEENYPYPLWIVVKAKTECFAYVSTKE
jgi:hypothetical protein